jgi:DNA-binding protein H-NS
MSKIDLNTMSLAELKDLQREVNKAVVGYEDRKKREALLQLEEKARELGFTVSELTGTKIARTRAPATAKYANPDNAAETWSGRGRKPRWFQDAIDAGKTEESMAI